MSRTNERYKVVRPSSPRAQAWMDSELSRFREAERDSLSDLIDAASMAQWVADRAILNPRG